MNIINTVRGTGGGGLQGRDVHVPFACLPAGSRVELVFLSKMEKYYTRLQIRGLAEDGARRVGVNGEWARCEMLDTISSGSRSYR